VTHQNIHIDPRFLDDIESGIGPTLSADPRRAPDLLNNYAILLRRWLRQNEKLRDAGIEPDTFVNGGVVTYLTIMLKRAWGLGMRDYPGFMETEEGANKLWILNKMYDVVTNAGAGHAFLEAHRNIYEAVVADLLQREVVLTGAVKTCFEDSDIDWVSEGVFQR